MQIGSDLASEEPREVAVESQPNGKAEVQTDGRARPEADGAAEGGFHLAEDLTPYELRTICKSIADLREPASFVEIFGSIRDLDERGELELSREEIEEIISAMLAADYLNRVREKPYKEARADMTFYALNRDKEEVKSTLAEG